ncbi:hypothetical protein POTOM_005606 [Populus tomentosa]|uniref:Uncharacterized protein n=1 Tax=Populus tomentosa TaxID=118781 RepID=A0A8X8AMF2_POPTO|nr:hypothetical protein POTOM_005606 [Populus tomentosa]
MASFGSLKSAVFYREERKQQYQSHIRGLNAYDRHKKFLNDYVNYYGKGKSTNEKLPIKTDRDTLREGYRFIRSEEDDMDASWEQRLVKRYYDKLFKELFEDIALLTCHTTRLASIAKCFGTIKALWKLTTLLDLIGLRWRTENEVISGKGQFICGNKHCDVKDGLASYEASVYTSSNKFNSIIVCMLVYSLSIVTSCSLNLATVSFLCMIFAFRCLQVNFSYFEAGENKQALVKLILCDRWKAHSPSFRELLEVVDDLDNEGSEEKRRGLWLQIMITCKKPTISEGSKKTDDDDNFDEFLEGMFP